MALSTSRTRLVVRARESGAHGYAYDASSHALFDEVYEDAEDQRWPHMRARKPFGRIAIANADSAASAMLEAAVEQGHRAVMELS